MRTAAYMKMAVTGVICCVGGPALVYWVSPTEEELFKKYNPDLQKRSLEGRYERQKDFDDFVTQLKEHAKSDKPIWIVQQEFEAKRRQSQIDKARAAKQQVADDIERRRQEIKSHSAGA